MTVDIDKIDKKDWGRFSEEAHKIAFKEIKPKEWDRIDYALLGRHFDTPMGYVTCREVDAHTVYWQFGGAFPGTKSTSLSFLTYQGFVNWTKNRYERIVTYIENDNLVMLKMAMKVGFRITGVRVYKDSILLEHTLETANV